MSLTIKVPPVGESITEVTLSSWKKKDGDHVDMDEVIAELESDKATFELTAEKAGILKTAAKEGDTLPIGAVVATIEENGVSKAPAKDAAPAAEAKPAVVSASVPAPVAVAPQAKVPPASGGFIQVKVPPVGESITEVTLSRWIKKDGDTVAMDDAIAELESDKATFELTAEKPGVLKTLAKEGDTLPIGAVVCTIEASAGASADKVAPAETPSVSTATTASSGGYAAGTPSPAAAKILAEKGIEPKAVTGTGVAGRITKEDAILAQKTSENPQITKDSGRSEGAPQAAQPVKKAEPAAVVPVISGPRSERREKMSSLRKTVAKRLVAVKNETAMLTTFNEVDM